MTRISYEFLERTRRSEMVDPNGRYPTNGRCRSRGTDPRSPIPSPCRAFGNRGRFGSPGRRAAHPRRLQAVHDAWKLPGGLGPEARDFSAGAARAAQGPRLRLQHRGRFSPARVYPHAASGGQLSHTPTAVTAVVVYRRRVGRRSFRRCRHPHRPHGSFGRTPLRRPRATSPHEAAAEGPRGQSDPDSAFALCHRVPLPGCQEPLPGPLGGPASRGQQLQFRLRRLPVLATLDGLRVIARADSLRADRGTCGRGRLAVSHHGPRGHRQLWPGVRGRAAPPG